LMTSSSSSLPPTFEVIWNQISIRHLQQREGLCLYNDTCFALTILQDPRKDRWWRTRGSQLCALANKTLVLTLKLLNHSDESQPRDPVIVHKQQSPVLQFILAERRKGISRTQISNSLSSPLDSSVCLFLPLFCLTARKELVFNL
jgi:hypothetical protein